MLAGPIDPVSNTDFFLGHCLAVSSTNAVEARGMTVDVLACLFRIVGVGNVKTWSDGTLPPMAVLQCVVGETRSGWCLAPNFMDPLSRLNPIVRLAYLTLVYWHR